MAEDEISEEENLWGAAAEDLEEQRQMLKDDAGATVEAVEDGVTDTAPESQTTSLATSEETDDKYSRVLDIPLNLSVELGDAKMLINDLLQLGQGSVIELAKLVGEPLDVLINGKLVAKGEVVVVNEKFGVRLTEIVSHQERIDNLA